MRRNRDLSCERERMGESPIQHAAFLRAHPVPQPARRICSGSCDYFTPVYQSGRKIAGVGMCENARCGADVRVGMICLWAKKSLSSETFLAPYGNVLRVRPQIAS